MFNTILLALTVTATAPATEPPAPVVPQKPAAQQRYCVTNTVTGSRIPVRECHTRDEWLKLGFDPLDPK